ncbi:MAG: hypothetical protein LBB88_06460 [Planctomycetaceae bacterium]|nr:hypothetical protein [Planctomycetaceae bacterium]
MKKLFVLVALLSFCVCLSSGCCNNNTPDTPTSGVTYLTFIQNQNNNPVTAEIYVTSQPIEGATNYQWVEPGTGKYSSSGYYFSNVTTNEKVSYAYATKWSDGSITLSTGQFKASGYDESHEEGYYTTYNDTSFVSYDEHPDAQGTEYDFWLLYNAPDGHKKDDYTYDSDKNEFIYNGDTAGNTLQQIADALGSAANVVPDDDEDINEDISENDEINTNQLR